MEETLSGKLFVNSRQVGDYIEITMPKAEKKPEEQIRIQAPENPLAYVQSQRAAAELIVLLKPFGHLFIVFQNGLELIIEKLPLFCQSDACR